MNPKKYNIITLKMLLAKRLLNENKNKEKKERKEKKKRGHL